ncbi:MAG: DNA repair protein RadC [Patescibacteria group bacterium]
MKALNTRQKNIRIKSPYVQIGQGDLLFMEKSPSYNQALQKQYILKVQDMPEDEKPREKMLLSGPASLSLVELLAVILMSGTKKEDVMSIAHRIVKEYGQSVLSGSERDAVLLAKELSIPAVKACQIIAVGEIGRRLFSKNLSGLATIRTPEDVYAYVKDMHNLPKEQLRGLYLDTHHKVIHDEILSIGTINASMIHPREVFKPAIEYGAAAIILVHNHPSGVSTPSASDKAITEQIIMAGKVLGISLLDHVVVTRDSFNSVPVQYE